MQINIKHVPIYLIHCLVQQVATKAWNLHKNSFSFPFQSNRLLPLPSTCCSHFVLFFASMIKEKHSNLSISLIILRT